MNDFLHLGFIGSFGGGEIILIFLVMLFLAVPLAIVLLVVFLYQKQKLRFARRRKPRTHCFNPKFCHHCGSALTNPNANFCSNCGKSL